jgi:predicted acetyltransferase
MFVLANRSSSMSEIRPFSEADLDEWITIVAGAYPSFDLASEEDRNRLRGRFLHTLNEDPAAHLYGLWREGRLLGGMRLHDFSMRLLSTQAPVGGVGLVAVDLFHKREHVAKELITFFLSHYRERGVTLTALYPFRPDFYKQMGFGYGAKMHQYRVKPAALPAGGQRRRVRPLAAADREALRQCYNRCLQQTHGLIEKSESELGFLFDAPGNRLVGYERDGAITGYMLFQFKRGKHFLLNDIEVREFLYEESEALSGLLAFLHSQADQINEVVFFTQDEQFHHLLRDPRNGTNNLLPHVFHESNTSGVGIMYRVIDTQGIFRTLREHNFGGQSLRLKLTLDDSFFPANSGDTLVHFVQGHPRLAEGGDYEAALRLDVADFSALLMGTVDLRSLHRYGLAVISDPAHLAALNRLFMVEQPPICTTRF